MNEPGVQDTDSVVADSVSWLLLITDASQTDSRNSGFLSSSGTSQGRGTAMDGCEVDIQDVVWLGAALGNEECGLDFGLSIFASEIKVSTGGMLDCKVNEPF
jgi:hypothetical protein